MATRIQLLGPLAMDRDAEAVKLPARKSEALLAVLALRPGVAYGREWLSALLWPDVAEAQARTSLRQAVGHLRKAFGEAFIVSSAEKIHVDPRATWADTAELERVLARPAREREAATELWRGTLLEGFPAIEQPFVDWLEGERARLVERVAARLEECLAALSAAGEIERALRVGARTLEVEPTREAVHRAVMRLRAMGGDRVAALRQYERCRDVLERQFAIAPARETELLRQSLLGESAGGSDRAQASTFVKAGGSAKPVDNATAGDGANAGDGTNAGRAVEPGVERSLNLLNGRVPLAILPFEPDSTDAKTRLLASGLTEDITTELSRFRELAILGRGPGAEAMVQPGQIVASSEKVVSRLSLSGSVRAASGRARITAALTDTTTGLELWRERWDVSLDDPFGVIDRMTRSIVGALSLRIDEARLGLARERPTERLEVYECWLCGLECLRRGTPESDEQARAFFQRALELSPHFARGYAGISLSHFNDWSCQAWDLWDERERLSFENARRAVELDDNDHVTHTILARIHVYRREFEVGERHLELALSLNSNDPNMLIHSALAYAQLGHARRACELAGDALALNPVSPAWYYPMAAFAHFVARDPEQALRLAQRAPDAFVDTRALLAAASAHLNDEAAARDHAQRFVMQFRLKIVSQREIDPSEPVAWLLRVSPFKREEDTEYLLDGLRRAGLG